MVYHSLHKFRHGHAVYAISNAEDVATLKTVSQNLLHANLSITDGIYGVLPDRDVRARIIGMGNSGLSSRKAYFVARVGRFGKLLRN
jgi:hypothetical protein